MAVGDWSTTAANNTSVGGINIAEGMNPSGVNDAQRGTMAEIATWYADVERDFAARANVFDWLSASEQADVLAGTLSLDHTDSLEDAFESGESFTMPAGTYGITRPMQVLGEGRIIRGAGRFTKGTRFAWGGTDNTKNIFEFPTQRRDSGSTNGALRGVTFGDIYLYTIAGSSCANWFWVEDGNLFLRLQNIYAQVLNGAPPAEAMIKLVSGTTGGGVSPGGSYSNYSVISNVALRGDLTNSQTAYTPIGLHVQSAIEWAFEHLRIFDVQEGIVIGDPTASNYRNAQALRFYNILCEVGDRDNATTAGSALTIYDGTDISFIGSKLTMGAGAEGTGTWGDGRVVRFKNKVSNAISGIKFTNTLLWGVGETDYLIEVGSNSEVFQCSFSQCEFSAADVGVVEVLTPPAAPNIHFDDETNVYRRIPVSHARFQMQGSRIGATTYPTGHTVTTVDNIIKKMSAGPTLAVLSQNAGEPIVVQAAQRNNSTQQMDFTAYNAGSAGAVLTSTAALRMREFAADEILAMSPATGFTPGTISNNSEASKGVSLFGAALGDFVVAGFWNGATTALQGVLVGVYAYAANAVAVKFENFSGSAKTITAGSLRVVKLNPGRFDFFGSASIDADSVPANSIAILSVGSTEQEITVTGAEVGCTAVCACSVDLSGLAAWPVITAAGKAKIVLFNGTGSAVNLSTATWSVGVYANYQVK